MGNAGSAVNVRVAGSAVRGLIIVSRDRPDLWQTLTQEFGQDNEFEIILDRRKGERRSGERLSLDDQVTTDRRSFPRIEDDVRLRQYVLVRPHHRTPRD